MSVKEAETHQIDMTQLRSCTFSRSREWLVTFEDNVALFYKEHLAWFYENEFDTHYATSKVEGILKGLDVDRSARNKKRHLKMQEEATSMVESNSPPPIWNFKCVREIENEKRERIERMGVFPAFMADMSSLANKYGTMATKGQAFLDELGGDASDDERCREISARHAKLRRGNA
jgi:hypothetical protein